MENEKFDKDTALAKIKILINKFYENLGREEFEDTSISMQELIENIDGVLNNTNISTKHLIMAQFNSDKEEKEEGFDNY